jgi:phage baseplate assembly protein W
MAFGYSAVLPLQKDDADGFYVLTKTIAQNIKQNFKNLLLTAPGERVMLPNFGVGLKEFLFRNNSFELQNDISDRVNSQVKLYMPFLDVDKIEFFEEETVINNFKNTLSIKIFYSVPSTGLTDMIALI